MIEYRIYPAIGIARVGDAPEKFYIEPDRYCGLPVMPDGKPFTQQDFRDAEGRLCRQAARFKVYKVENGVSEEVTLNTDGVHAIRWTAHLANKKPSWYTFVPAEGEGGYAPNHPLRNPQAADRRTLLIDAGPRQISGRSQQGEQFSKNTVPDGYEGAHFPPSPLYPMNDSIDTLGELRTDQDGRLLVLGGYGVSGSADPDATITDYANNDGWWDDTSDGPVSAVIELSDGSRIEALPAHVLVAPPKYAPEVPNLITLYDTIFDALVRSGHYPALYENGFWKSGADGFKPNFHTEIRPLLERATYMPWVAAIPPKPHHFDFEKLGATGTDGLGAPEYQGFRQYILDFIRPPYQENDILTASGATMMPYLAGDNCLVLSTATSKYMRLTDTQYFMLQQWVAGWFVNHPEEGDAAESLTRAALDNCVGGPFSPGIEMTWISRNPAIYRQPFRIRNHFVPEGPLSLDFDLKRGMEPGDVTRYMAIPWQADFNECSSQPLDGRRLWWWPAQRPEFVYLEPQPQPRTLAAASPPPPPDQETGKQVPWLGTDYDQLAGDFIQFADDIDMVKYWAGLGFVMEKQVDGERRFVEVERELPRPFDPAHPPLPERRNER
ncbi:LodA/GoxA family CTQ-dependent oxidase [Chromobacterium piscinae]|uniref:LodA/GoxA family CTQ-dependent oxidase n=1 Tax=Chromobacterium piscinae TaxID=686831 RepID=UPI001E61AE55|nr:LodA/GoxA family CTQ-dependent oxidase [Chromobacterium piscinae]MCD4506803.1 LodA/GoxA family CTQ-dependent oxidase [Chromobacterium piscinae]